MLYISDIILLGHIPISTGQKLKNTFVWKYMFENHSSLDSIKRAHENILGT